MRRTTRSHVVRRTAAATVAIVALTGLGACGDDEPNATDTTDTSAAVEPADAGETVDPESFVDDVLGGLEDASTAHLAMTMEGGPAGITMEGDVDYSATPPNLAMTMTNELMGGGEMQIRLVDGVMYMQMPDVGRSKWVKLDLGGEGSPLDENLMKQMDPGAQLETFKDSVTKVEFVGDEDVDGETLKHYTMTVRSDAFRELQDQLGTEGGEDLPEVVTYDVWTDSDGMLRQTEVELGKLGSVTITISDWGQPVDIEAPPESDVIEMPGGLPTGSAA
jgi:hypothetical protein